MINAFKAHGEAGQDEIFINTSFLFSSPDKRRCSAANSSTQTGLDRRFAQNALLLPAF